MKTNWQTKKLGEVCDFQNGLAFKSAEYVDSGFFVMRIGNVQDGYISLSDPKYIQKSHKPFDKFILLVGDILISLTGNVGRVGVIKAEHLPAVINQRVARIVLKNNNLAEKQFLLYFLESPYFIGELIGAGHGAAQQNISTKDIEKLEILLPPLPEQHRIVRILDGVFENISKVKENTEKNLQNSKDLFDNYLHSIFTNNSSGWEFKKLSEVAEYFNGLTYSPKDVSDKGIIVLRSSNIQNDDLDFSDIVRVDRIIKDKIIVHDGDILMCSRNGSKRLVGKTATINNLKEKMTFGTFMMIVRSNQNSYLKWFFKSSEFRRQITRGENTMINQITRYMLDDVIISFPPLEKQESIVKKLDALSEQTKKLEEIYKKKLEGLEELKKSVLQKAFAGEL